MSDIEPLNDSAAVCSICGSILHRLTPQLWAHHPADLRRFGLHKARPRGLDEPSPPRRPRWLRETPDGFEIVDRD